MTPERMAAMEAAAADDVDADAELVAKVRPRTSLDEEQSPVAGRRFSRA